MTQMKRARSGGLDDSEAVDGGAWPRIEWRSTRRRSVADLSSSLPAATISGLLLTHNQRIQREEKERCRAQWWRGEKKGRRCGREGEEGRRVRTRRGASSGGSELLTRGCWGREGEEGERVQRCERRSAGRDMSLFGFAVGVRQFWVPCSFVVCDPNGWNRSWFRLALLEIA